MSMRNDAALCVDRLASAQRDRLYELPSLDVPRKPGIYVLWHGCDLLYVGMVWRDPQDTSNPRAAGLAGRLRTHRDCPMTERFALAVARRYVVPNLADAERKGLATGTTGFRSIKVMTRQWVWDNVDFSVEEVRAVVARKAEATIQRSGLPGSEPPALNALH